MGGASVEPGFEGAQGARPRPARRAALAAAGGLGRGARVPEGGLAGVRRAGAGRGGRLKPPGAAPRPSGGPPSSRASEARGPDGPARGHLWSLRRGRSPPPGLCGAALGPSARAGGRGGRGAGPAPTSQPPPPGSPGARLSSPVPDGARGGRRGTRGRPARSGRLGRVGPRPSRPGPARRGPRAPGLCAALYVHSRPGAGAPAGAAAAAAGPTAWSAPRRRKGRGAGATHRRPTQTRGARSPAPPGPSPAPFPQRGPAPPLVSTPGGPGARPSVSSEAPAAASAPPETRSASERAQTSPGRGWEAAPDAAVAPGVDPMKWAACAHPRTQRRAWRVHLGLAASRNTKRPARPRGAGAAPSPPCSGGGSERTSEPPAHRARGQPRLGGP